MRPWIDRAFGPGGAWRLAASIAALAAVTVAPSVTEAEEPSLGPIEIVRASGPISIDGDLSDAGWSGVREFTLDYEIQPADNTTPSVRTRARIAFDDEALYVAFDCDDPEPAKIRAPFSDRDRIGHYQQDLVQLFLDTRNDRRASYIFAVNPRGLQNDSIFSEAAQNEDPGPDFTFQSAAKIDAHGWYAEMRIPFSSLHYERGEAPVWGVILAREYPRDFKFDFETAPIPRSSPCLLCHMRSLVGLRDLPGGARWVLAPFATAARRSEREPPGDLTAPLITRSIDSDVGIDVKWSPTPNHTIDLALNPDFSQIEADLTQIGTNSRFALFYPEKRPLFLESVDLFDMPLRAVSTRTITDPSWGARATGQWGDSSYTLMVARDDGGGSVVLPGPESSDLAPQQFASNVAIGRLRHSSGSSFAGMMVSAREWQGGGYNRVIGPDFQWRPNEADAITGQLLFSDTELPDRPDLAADWDGRRLRSTAASLDWLHLTRRFVNELQFNSIGAGFRDDNGFIPQVGFRDLKWVTGPNFYPEKAVTWLHPYIVAEIGETTSGDRLNRAFTPGINFDGPQGLSLDTRYHLAEQIRSGGRLFDLHYAELEMRMSPSRRFDQLKIELRLGEDVDFVNTRLGTGGVLRGSATIRPWDRLELVLDGERQWLDVRETDRARSRLFSATVERVKATIHFTSRAYLRLLSERVKIDRDAALYLDPVESHEESRLDSALLSYKLTWQTLAYLGYESGRSLSPSGDLAVSDKQIFLKLGYAWRH